MPEMLHRMGHFHAGSVGGDGSQKVPKKGVLAAIRQSIPLGWRQSVTRCMPRSMRYQPRMKWVCNSGIDWSRSKLFCIPNSNEGYFRVNLRGREPLGIVTPGMEYDELLGSLQETLQSLRNPANSKKAAERVVLMDEAYPGAQHQSARCGHQLGPRCTRAGRDRGAVDRPDPEAARSRHIAVLYGKPSPDRIPACARPGCPSLPVGQ